MFCFSVFIWWAMCLRGFRGPFYILYFFSFYSAPFNKLCLLYKYVLHGRCLCQFSAGSVIWVALKNKIRVCKKGYCSSTVWNDFFWGLLWCPNTLKIGTNLTHSNIFHAKKYFLMYICFYCSLRSDELKCRNEYLCFPHPPLTTNEGHDMLF